MKTALILVDVINDFFHPQGSNYHTSFIPLLDNVRLILGSARRHGAVVIHAMEGHLPGHDHDFEWRKLPRHILLGSFEAEPAKGVDILKGEYEVRKRRYSAFFATGLDLLLRECGVGTVVVAGVKTNVCVRATAQDAFALGYDVLVVREAVGSNFRHLHEASLEDIERYFGRTISMDECMALFESEANDRRES